MRMVATVLFLCMAIVRAHAAREDPGVWFKQDGKDLIITSQPSHQPGQFVVQSHVGTVTAKHVVLELRYIYRAKSVEGEGRNQKAEVLWRLTDTVKKDDVYYEIKQLEPIYLTDQEIEKLTSKEKKTPPANQATQMREKEVVAIAETTAKAEGFDLAKYEMTGCHFQCTMQDGTWTVFFQMKPPAPPGGHFTVTVVDQTKKAALMWGE